uniref:Uncharacterized protein n=1 Tax=Romanomermis culicivorax TaxID=13658 RepID=A0A915JBD3_ROMCU
MTVTFVNSASENMKLKISVIYQRKYRLYSNLTFHTPYYRRNLSQSTAMLISGISTVLDFMQM